MKKTITIATRESELALWQSRYVAKIIEEHTAFKTRLLPMTTEGDQKLSVTLSKIGGKGLFLKELEQSMLLGDADIAVHSMKDVPAKMENQFSICSVFPRADVSDAFVSNSYKDLNDLPLNSTVGTSSLRRQAQLLARRPDLNIKPLRGNVNTRLRKLDEGQYDAIVLASAGLIRLGMEERIKSRLLPPDWLPAVAQGAIGIECLSNNKELIEVLGNLSDSKTWTCINAERALNLSLNGSCSVAIGAYADFDNTGQLQIKSAVFSPDGSINTIAEVKGDCPQSIGEKAALMLLDQGAQAILDMADD